MKQPPVIDNPLAALGRWFVGATVHVGRVPVTAGAPQEGYVHVGCMSLCVGVPVLLVATWKLQYLIGGVWY